MKKIIAAVTILMGITLNAQWTDNGNRITTSDNVGIGTTNPTSKFVIIEGNGGMSLNSIGLGFNRNVHDGQIFDGSKSAWQFTARDERFSLEGYNGALSSPFNVLKNGNIGIGTDSPDAKLAVNGNIHTKEVKVDLVGWPDYVFENEYNLPTLQEVETHIEEKGHLQDIPSAKEVEENGIKLGEMNSKLLQKIEELMLYTIRQQKEIEELKSEISQLKKTKE